MLRPLWGRVGGQLTVGSLLPPRGFLGSTQVVRLGSGCLHPKPSCWPLHLICKMGSSIFCNLDASTELNYRANEPGVRLPPFPQRPPLHPAFTWLLGSQAQGCPHACTEDTLSITISPTTPPTH